MTRLQMKKSVQLKKKVLSRTFLISKSPLGGTRVSKLFKRILAVSPETRQEGQSKPQCLMSYQVQSFQVA